MNLPPLELLIDRTPLPWAELITPTYTPYTVGHWDVELGKFPPVMRGYFRGLTEAVPPYCLTLRYKGEVWMSNAIMETESQQHALAAMHGVVVIAGGGLGITTFNALQNPKVTKVILLDNDRDIIQIIEHSHSIHPWPNWDKLQIWYADALTVRAGKMACVKADFLWADIWPRLGGEENMEEALAIQERVQAKTFAWWGMELDFMHWMAECYRDLPPVRSDFVDWRHDIDKRILMVDDHHSWAHRVAMNVVNF